MANKRLNYEIGFTADTRQLQAALKQAVQSLEQLGTNPQYLRQGLQDASKAALELSINLQRAYNTNTGKFDLTRFRQELDHSNTSIKQYAQQLKTLGPDGEKAFLQVASAISTAELPLKRTNQMFSQLWISMKNTARWKFTTGTLNTLTGIIETAYGYSKNLNESLNNIRIVTEKSTESMAKFAQQANAAAKNLSTTTTNYTDASLIYYQQGLPDQEVQDRTETTIKMANVTGQSAETVSEQMTAIWNNFKEGSRTLESYADAMVALGAKTASSSKEIAEGVQQFASVADVLGLSFDYAAAALTTITANTRETAAVAGNALKTLFSRIEGLTLGETLEDGTDLNKYSEALMKVGIDIKDVNGELKNMDTIIDEIGAKWQTLHKDEQMALAETIAGK